MQTYRTYLALCLVGFLIPLLPVQGKTKSEAGFPGWLSQFEGRPLIRLPLTQREIGFYKGFPGKAARFSDGAREIIFRWVTSPTRKLHPAADCFKGVGYRIQPLPIALDKKQHRWGSFSATRAGKNILVQERIHDHNGNNWTDASSWYWSALLDRSDGPWWAITVASRSDSGEGE